MQDDGRTKLSFFDLIASAEAEVLEPTGFEHNLLLQASADGGSDYSAVRKTLLEMTAEQVIDSIKSSRLRDRDLDGRYVWERWHSLSQLRGTEKAIICDLGAKDTWGFAGSVIAHRTPHELIQSIVIAGYAVGASFGCIYIPGDYAVEAHTLNEAVHQARSQGYLGTRILGTPFDFDIHISVGTKCYSWEVENRLLHSGKIEGAVHSMETLANITRILTNGPDWFSSVGDAGSAGTKLIRILGDVRRQGVVEVPLGITLREILFGIAGGMSTDSSLKAVLLGGLLGSFVGKEAIDRQLSYDDLLPGSGQILILDESRCVVDTARMCAELMMKVSCNQCVPCREGIKHLHDMLNACTSGDGCKEYIELAEELIMTIRLTSKCSIGRQSASLMQSAFDNFSGEIKLHALDGHCPTDVCGVYLPPVSEGWDE
jgi:NADP-reducing hydrogenase subunit HndC